MNQCDAHLLLLDPDPTKRELLRTFLKRQGFLISGARDTDHAARLLAGLDFDLIILDDAASCDELRDLTEAPVLWLAGAGSVREGEVIFKPYEPSALVERINLMLDRRPPPTRTTPQVLRLGRLTYHIEPGELREGDAHVRLTATEVKLMRVLAGRPSAPITRAELADEMGDPEPGSRAIDVQITRLRRKLEHDPKAPRYLQTVRGTGYMLVPD